MASDFNSSVMKVINLADSIGMLMQAGVSSSYRASNHIKSYSRNSCSYKELYDEIIKYQEFNLMLVDGSFFQFTEAKENKDLRLVFYPNPYQFIEFSNYRKELAELCSEEELSQIEIEQLLSENNFTSDIPLIRYDLSLKQHCDLYHPAGHFHIGFFAENRWPVNRILSPLAFFFKILCSYYPSIWKEKGEKGAPAGENLLEQQYRQELQNHCSKISIEYPEYFTDIESKRLCFT